MTRSELQEAIDVQRSRIAFEDETYPKAQDQLMLNLLLAEQKRSEGCDSCHDKNSHEIMMELKWTHCPHCGRDLTEGESV